MFLSELLQDWPHDLRCVCSFLNLSCLHILILIQLWQCWHVFVFHLWGVIAVRESPHHNRAPSVDSAFCLSIITPFHIPVIPHRPALPPHPAPEPNRSRRCTVVHSFTAHAYFRATSWTCLLWLTVGHPGVWIWAHLNFSESPTASSHPSPLPLSMPLIPSLPTSLLLRSQALEWPCARGCHGELLLSQQRRRTNGLNSYLLNLSLLPPPSLSLSLSLSL